jgi:DNA-binding response OmpR family regulator
MPRILVIDDSLSALQMFDMILAEAGHEACTCREGKRALELLERERFDVIITDIYMPDVDGLELIRAGRRIRPDTPILAVSGMTGPRDMLKAARFLGARQTIHKPFSKADLLAAVEAALGRSVAAEPCRKASILP